MPLQRITTNTTGTVRHDQMEGRDFLVVPMVMLCEGVHAGSGGPLFYPADELRKTPAVWNHKPIVVYHPQDAGGNGISACDPDVLTKSKVGVIMNTRYRKPGKKGIGKLHAEAWLEVERLEAVDARVLEALESDTVMELSTGLFTDNEPAAGDWNGEKYSYIARNYRPDHLALLPDKVGACSVADGAGFLRLNQAEPDSPPSLLAAATFYGQADLVALAANAKSYGNITNDLYSLVQTKYGDRAWVSDVYDDFFIFQKEGKLYKQGYTASDTKTELSADKPQEVVRVSEYRTVDGAFVGNVGHDPQQKEPAMAKEDVVNALIANGATQWAEADRAFLLGLDEVQLAKFAPVVPATPAPAPVGNQTATPPATPAAPVVNTQPPAKQQSWDELVANADPATRSMLSSMKADHEARKTELIGKITANKACAFSPEFLAGKDLSELQALAALAAQPEAPAATPMFRQPNYSGQATPPVANAQTPAVAPLVMGRMDFSNSN